MSTDESHSQMGQSVGAKIRAARQAKKYTQNQLARPDFSVSYISAIERGQIHPSLRALEILAQRLHISIADLLPRPNQQSGGPPLASGNGLAIDDWELLLLEAQVSIHQGDLEQVFALLHSPHNRERADRHQEMLFYYILGRAHAEANELHESEQALA